MSQQLTYEKLTDDLLEEINDIKLKRKDAIDVLKWAYHLFDDDIVYACSLGAEGMVLIDLISKVRRNAKVIFLDTDFHFKETYELFEKIKEKYPEMKLEMIKPGLTVEEQAEQHGGELWKTQPDLCCQIRKIKPLEKELSKYDAWISGLRREQSPSRKNTQFVNKDNRFSSIKICPLVNWTWDEVWLYIKLHDLTYNELHDKSYPSIGCENCTLPVTGNGDSRAGRWAGSGKTECGLHQ